MYFNVEIFCFYAMIFQCNLAFNVLCTSSSDSDFYYDDPSDNLVPSYYGSPSEQIINSSGKKTANWTEENSEVAPHELGDYFQSDIFQAPNEEEYLMHNALSNPRRLWPNKTIPFDIDDHIATRHREMILNTIPLLNSLTCLKFRKKRPGDRNYVLIHSKEEGCYSSQLGFQPGRSAINLQAPQCMFRPTIVHELLHVTGFIHEQCRPDRDEYIDVLWENIKENTQSNFKKYDNSVTEMFGTKYDYDSIMHYSSMAFSKNNRPTMLKKNGEKISRSYVLSKTDLYKIRRLYKCKGASFSSDLLFTVTIAIIHVYLRISIFNT